jgi:hypothetical protein
MYEFLETDYAVELWLTVEDTIEVTSVPESDPWA